MAKTKSEKDIAKIGEFGLIHLLTSKIKLKNSSSVMGVGDDAAVIDMTNKKTVVTTDLLTEGIHFDLMYTPLKHLGYKAVVVNLSDIYAMNAKPTQVLVSVAISAKFTTEMVKELYEGIHLACEFYGVDLVGGDTSSSLTGLMLSITAIGEAQEEELVYRSGAQENDLLCVSGDLGAAYMGLQLLEREKQVFRQTGETQPDLSGNDYILERQLKPEARHDIIKQLKELQIKPTAMIDISDGLSSEILHICESSNKGCRVYADKIPIADETKQIVDEMGMEPATVALNGGEDYELLFTVPLEHYDKMITLPGVAVIGHINKKDEGKYLVNPDGSLIEIQAMGWDGLSDEEED